MNYKKQAIAIKSELDGLREKHQGFSEQLAGITSNLRGLERQKVGLVYKSVAGHVLCLSPGHNLCRLKAA